MSSAGQATHFLEQFSVCCNLQRQVDVYWVVYTKSNRPSVLCDRSQASNRAQTSINGYRRTSEAQNPNLPVGRDV